MKTFVILIGTLACTFAICGSPAASARTYFFLPLWRMLTCEMYLKPQLRELATKETIIASLNSIESQLDSKRSKKGKLPSSSQSLYDRLQAIKARIFEPDENTQTVSFAIRGENFDAAISQLTESQRALVAEYKEQLKDETAIANYKLLKSTNLGLLLDTAFPALGFYMMYYFLTEPIHATTGLGFSFTILFRFLAINGFLRLGSSPFKFWDMKLDMNYTSLIKVLKKAATKNTVDGFYFDSKAFPVPSEFGSFLMSDGLQGDRTTAFAQNMGGMLGAFPNPKMGPQRMVQEAGIPLRILQTDQIVFYDSSLKQPVWLFFFQMSRLQVPPKKPNAPRTTTSESRDWDWIPGAQPAPAAFAPLEPYY